MTLVYDPGIKVTGEAYYSFPQPITMWSVEEENIYTEHIIPDSTGAVITGLQPGPLRIRIQGIITGDTPAEILAALGELRGKLAEQAFELYRYHGGSDLEYYKGVYSVSFAHRRTDRPLTHLPWSAEFTATDPTIHTD